MFEVTLSQDFRLWRTRRERDRLLHPIRAAMTKASQAGDYDEEQSLAANHFSLQDEAEDRILSLRSRHICNLADKYVVAVPPLEDKEAWAHWKTDNRRVYLTSKESERVQLLIHTEQKHLREARRSLAAMAQHTDWDNRSANRSGRRPRR